MYTKLLNDPKVFLLLLKFDEELASEHHGKPCAHCGSRLDSANYNRKPRGGPMMPLETPRFSFCCRNPQCRRRSLAPSVRFLSRKVYLSIIVTLFTAMTQGLAAGRACRLYQAIGVKRQTLKRWRGYWRERMPVTSFWKEAKGYFREPVDVPTLPQSLVSYFRALYPSDENEMVLKLLCLIRPLSAQTI